MLGPIQCYRAARWLYLHKVPLLPRVIDRLSVLIFCCYLPCTAEIGPGSAVGYWGMGIVLHERAHIGRNVFISHGVTVGGRSQRFKVPIIEDNVYIGAGAKVLGDIVLGEGCLIGANAVVIHSVPPRSIAAGVPARTIRQNINVQDYTGWPEEQNTNGKPRSTSRALKT
jgi:serine O-acetyltransferase